MSNDANFFWLFWFILFCWLVDMNLGNAVEYWYNSSILTSIYFSAYIQILALGSCAQISLSSMAYSKWEYKDEFMYFIIP